MQNRSLEEIARTNEDLKLRCPMTKDYFLYPILASDGRHYELKLLLTWLAAGNIKSPITNAILTHAVYDRNLKNKIDKLLINGKISIEDVYPDYKNVDNKLTQLHQYLPEPLFSQHDALYASTGIALLVGLALYITYGSAQDNIDGNKPNIMLYMIGAFALAFFLRCTNRPQYGLFGLFRDARNILDRLPTSQHIHDIEDFFDPPRPH